MHSKINFFSRVIRYRAISRIKMDAFRGLTQMRGLYVVKSQFVSIILNSMYVGSNMLVALP